MAKCGICGMETPKKPEIKENGKCSACNQELAMKEKSAGNKA